MGIIARFHPNASNVSSVFMLRMNNGCGRRKLFTIAPSSLRNVEHPRSRVHPKKCHRRHRHQQNATCATNATADHSNGSSAIDPPPAQLTSDEELSAIVRKFPREIDYAFGYGSGVLLQRGDADPGMIDVVIATGDPLAWHERNLRRHSDHYSYMARVGGPRFVAWLQANFGARAYFHPFVNVDIAANDLGRAENSRGDEADGNEFAKATTTAATTTTGVSIRRQIKYGVVSTDDLIRDLIHWDYLYLAGRMHKPTVSIGLPSRPGYLERRPDDGEIADRADEIEDAQRTNLLSAVSASLLLLGATDDETPPSSVRSLPASQLYNTIASLSYTGDFRMRTGAEDPNKVQKLVESPGMIDLWGSTYSGTLDEMQRSGLIGIVDPRRGGDDSGAAAAASDPEGEGRRLECRLSDEAVRKRLVQNLPPRLREHSDRIVGTQGDRDSISKGSLTLRRELANIVAPAARSQSVKGFFTAGLSKSWKYAMAKFAKGRGK